MTQKRAGFAPILSNSDKQDATFCTEYGVGSEPPLYACRILACQCSYCWASPKYSLQRDASNV